MATRDALTEAAVIIGGLIAAVLLAALLVAGCGTSESTSRAQIGATVVCRDGETVMLTTTAAGPAVRADYPLVCPAGLWRDALVTPPLPQSAPETVVAFQSIAGTWHLVDESACTGLPVVDPLPTPGCPSGMPCVRGSPIPCR